MADTLSHEERQTDSSTPTQFFTVAQAARHLQVSHSTVWRWIESGKLPAYRVGPKTIRILRQDLDHVIRPATVPSQVRTTPLSDAEAKQGLAALARLRRRRTEVAANQGGKPFPPSADFLADLRRELDSRL